MQLVFATNNLNKLNEIKGLLPPSIKLLTLKDIGCFNDIPETQNTIMGNAIQKAEYIKTHFGYDCFADDTGLEVDALNGAPGVYSARYAGSSCNSDDNINKLLLELKNKAIRTAQFKTVIALHINGNMETFTGICEGEITAQKKGKQGFGYDPIFKPKGYQETFSQMSLLQKNTISHRGKAVIQLVDFFSCKLKNNSQKKIN